MPRGNHYGPWGNGPMSGRAMGYCAGAGMPGYAAMGYGPMRMGRRFGGMRGGMRFAAFEVPYPDDQPEEKLDMLRTRETWLEGQLNQVRQEISSMESKPEKAA